MNWLKKYLNPRNTPAAVAAAQPRLILRGLSEHELREAFLTSPDSKLFGGVLEQCDKLLMDGVNELVNDAEQMTDGQLRQRVGQLRGLTELREHLTQREAQARVDQQRLKAPENHAEDEN